MENIISIAFISSFILLIIFHIYQTNKFFIHLKSFHKDVWKELGQPQWRIHFGDDSFQNTMKYIRKKKFEHLNDTELDKIYKNIKAVEYISISIAMLIITLTIIDVL
jgi:hypothetical protein